jgi:hypothetical protein
MLRLLRHGSVVELKEAFRRKRKLVRAWARGHGRARGGGRSWPSLAGAFLLSGLRSTDRSSRPCARSVVLPWVRPWDGSAALPSQAPIDLATPQPSSHSHLGLGTCQKPTPTENCPYSLPQYLVFEYVERTMLQVLEASPSGLAPEAVRSYVRQLVAAVGWCHQVRGPQGARGPTLLAAGHATKLSGLSLSAARCSSRKGGTQGAGERPSLPHPRPCRPRRFHPFNNRCPCTPACTWRVALAALPSTTWSTGTSSRRTYWSGQRRGRQVRWAGVRPQLMAVWFQNHTAMALLGPFRLSDLGADSFATAGRRPAASAAAGRGAQASTQGGRCPGR